VVECEDIMSLKFGLYDFFGRIIPGFFYLIAFVQIGVLLHFYPLNLQFLSQMQLSTLLALGVIAYVLGTAFNPLSILWIRLFKPKDTLETAFQLFRKRNPDWRIKFQGMDWHVLLAYIRRNNFDMVEEIERPNASSLMMRNISLAFIILALIQFVYFFFVWELIFLALAIIFVGISVQLGKEAKFFQVMFFSLIFETIISYEINLDELLTKS
jgi:hypothetical protein